MLVKTTNKDNVLQVAIASLLELNIKNVPQFDRHKTKKWQKLFYFINYMEYKYDGCLYNPNWCKGDSNLITSIFGMKGVKEHFIAIVQHIDKDRGNHLVIVDKMFNIVNPILEEYENIKQFPRHEVVKYNGIKQILLINE